jgi:colanic acid biosynthesis glycosyl transferase WcaI
VVRNWVDLDAIRPMTGVNAYRTMLNLPNDAFVVLYAGAIGKKQVLHVVLDAAEKLADRPGIRFVIAGEGPELADIKSRYGGLPNVQFLPLQPADRLCELLNLADLHVLPQDRGVADLVLPSKLGGVLASGRRLVVMADPGTELHTFLGEVGILTEPGNAEALAGAIEEASRGERNTYEAGRRLADRLDSRINLAEFEAALIEAARHA